MIRNAVIHLNNEQPLVADLFELPDAAHVGLRCTNLRTLGGKRPVFADDSASVFFFPYLHIRFVEVPPAALTGAGLPVPEPVGGVAGANGANGTNGAPDVATSGSDGRAPGPGGDSDGELEIDEDFLRRIREV